MYYRRIIQEDIVTLPVGIREGIIRGNGYVLNMKYWIYIITSYLYISYCCNVYLNNNIGVLVHCYAGVQRSATVVLCYLLKYKNMSLDMAKAIMKEKRSIVFFPYPTFEIFINNYALII